MAGDGNGGKRYNEMATLKTDDLLDSNKRWTREHTKTKASVKWFFLCRSFGKEKIAAAAAVEAAPTTTSNQEGEKCTRRQGVKHRNIQKLYDLAFKLLMKDRTKWMERVASAFHRVGHSFLCLNAERVHFYPSNLSDFTLWNCFSVLSSSFSAALLVF